jgi:UDP:flavonoid glycosyltransferase YjiC (YdhE family)
MAESNQVKCFAFVFPLASGHINPSLPVARLLRKLGHEVHYVCAEQMREAIEDTGATLHSERDVEPELFEGRSNDLMELYGNLLEEYGWRGDKSYFSAKYMMKHILLELRLPGLLRFFQAVNPAAVVYCPVACAEAAWAAQVQDIPHIAIQTFAGPGMTLVLEQAAQGMKMTVEELDQKMRDFAPNFAAHKRLQLKYGLDLEGDGGLDKPIGRLAEAAHAALTMITNSEDLYDPITPELQKAYDSDNAKFVAVGPLLDEAGAKRSAGHKSNRNELQQDHSSRREAEIVRRVISARKTGRAVVLASMGTVITGDLPGWGWEGRPVGADGQPRGLTGRELCRGAWSAVFDAFGVEKTDEGPLIVLVLGPQKDALGEIIPPANAICAPTVPQVDVLRAGVDLFLTHGGQNSFTESLANGTPVVVCLGFGDQPVNGRKAVDLGVGTNVDRPDPDAGHEGEAVAAYRADVATSLLAVFGNTRFKATALRCSENLSRAGGVPRAVELVLRASQGTADFAAAQAGA